MKHIFGLGRNGNAGLILNGRSGRSIRQHLTGVYNHLSSKLPSNVTGTGIELDTKAIAKSTDGKIRQYMPLKFRL